MTLGTYLQRFQELLVLHISIWLDRILCEKSIQLRKLLRDLNDIASCRQKNVRTIKPYLNAG